MVFQGHALNVKLSIFLPFHQSNHLGKVRLGGLVAFVGFFDLFQSNHYGSCLFHLILTGRRMSKLVFIVKYLLLLSFLIVAEFYNLGHIQFHY